MKGFLLALIFLLTEEVSGQAQPIQITAKKIKSFKNLSYTDVVKTKFHFQDDFAADTLNSQLSIIPKGSNTEGYYLIRGRADSYAFDGNKLVKLNFRDSTYVIEQVSVEGQSTRTLLYWADQMLKLSKLSPSKIKQLRDTLINDVYYTNILITSTDTIIKNKRQYQATKFIIDKKNNLPLLILSNMQGNTDDGANFEVIESHNYSNFKFDRKDFPDLSIANIPVYFREPPKTTPAVLLANGSKAPSIKAYDLAGKPFNLANLKGSLVLINFSLIGCPHCVAAAQMLNRLNEKYQAKGLFILNVYPLDQKDVIMRFDKRENVKTLSLTASKTIQQDYPFDGYPTFYLLDKQGLVAQAYLGFYKDLELALTEKIDSLLK